MTFLTEVADVVTQVQKQAADIHLNPQEHEVASEVILREGGKDYTNAVDRAVEALQRRELKRAFPNIGFLGEETNEVTERLQVA